MVIFGLCAFMFVMFESSGSGYLFFRSLDPTNTPPCAMQGQKRLVNSTSSWSSRAHSWNLSKPLGFFQNRHSKIASSWVFSWHRKCVKWIQVASLHRGWGPANNSLQKRSGTPWRTESTRKRIQWIQVHYSTKTKFKYDGTYGKKTKKDLQFLL